VTPAALAEPVRPEAAPAAATTRRGRTPETARLYRADWKSFQTWCDAAGVPALPADPATVANFLADAAAKLGAGALGRRAAAIGRRHRALGLAAPTAEPAVRAILRDARRAAVPRRRPPPPPRRLLRLAASCPGDLAGLRDRALLLLAAAGLSRAALVGLDVEHLLFSATSVVLALPDKGGEGRHRTIPAGVTPRTSPVQALRDWLDASETKFGPVFRKVDRWGNVEQHRLGTDALRRILARRGRRRRARTPPA